MTFVFLWALMHAVIANELISGVTLHHPNNQTRGEKRNDPALLGL